MVNEARRVDITAKEKRDAGLGDARIFKQGLCF